jgi:alkylation response protein AidB-like acyl-CoA dehydrogenase
MNFQITAEQQMLIDSVQRFLERDYSFDARRKQLADPGSPRWRWQTLAELGLLGLIVSEEDGGIGGNAFDAMLVAQALAPALMLEPWHEVAIESVSLLQGLKSDPAANDPMLASKQVRIREALSAIASGDRLIVPAHDEASMQGNMMAVQTRAHPAGDGYVINGEKILVCAGALADQWLLTARMGAAEDAPWGVFLFGSEVPGVRVQQYPGMDSRWYADLSLRDCWLPSSALLSQSAAQAIRQTQAMRLMVWCADAQGCMRALVEQTAQYLQTRKQFGQAIGRFQALQHRAVDMFIHSEQAYSMLIRAADACERMANQRNVVAITNSMHNGDSKADSASKAAAHACDHALAASRLLIGLAARSVSQEAVQLHGGMGVTDELSVGHFFRRLTAFELRLGDTDYHNMAMARLLQ